MVHLVYTLLKGTFCSVWTSFPKKRCCRQRGWFIFCGKKQPKGKSEITLKRDPSHKKLLKKNWNKVEKEMWTVFVRASVFEMNCCSKSSYVVWLKPGLLCLFHLIKIKHPPTYFSHVHNAPYIQGLFTIVITYAYKWININIAHCMLSVMPAYLCFYQWPIGTHHHDTFSLSLSRC